MPASKGRNVTLMWNSSPIAGVRTKNVQINGEPVDISDDDSSGFRELMAGAGEVSVTLGLSGVTKDDTLRAAAVEVSGRTGSVILTYPDGTLAGTFYLASYNETGEYNGAVTFEAELQSTGAVSYT